MNYRQVPTDQLTVDPRYQRPIHEHRVAKMVSEWDPAQVGVLEVSRRADGTHVVFDGQHRLAALKLKKNKTAPCLVHEGLTPQDEATLFVRLQRERRAPTPVERYKAELFSGNLQAKQISDVLTKYGYKVGTGPNDVRAISSVERVVRKHGIETLDQAMSVIHDAWWGDRFSVDGAIIQGMADVMHQYHDRWTEQHTFNLKHQAPIDIKRRAQAKTNSNLGTGYSTPVAAEIRKAAGLRGRPPKVKA